MNEEIELILDDTKEQMQKTIAHLENELAKIRAGKASPQMLDSIFVDYYGVNSPLRNVANVNTPDPRTIMIQPYEKSLLQQIEKAIMQANLGLNPQNDGNFIRVNVPPLTEERRRDLLKQAKAEGEQCRVSIRSIRREANEYIKKMMKEGLPEDLAKDAETKVQILTDSYTAKADKHLEIKEKEIFTV